MTPLVFRTAFIFLLLNFLVLVVLIDLLLTIVVSLTGIVTVQVTAAKRFRGCAFLVADVLATSLEECGVSIEVHYSNHKVEKELQRS